jgi:predicted phage terminase large subunit-like protein
MAAKRYECRRYKLADLPPVNKYGASDYATKEDEGDFTEHGIFGIDKNKHIYICDWWYGQTTADKWIESLLDLVKLHQPFAWFGESGPIRRAVEPFLIKEMRERRDYVRLEWITKTHNKTISARAFQALCSNSEVWVPWCEWGDRLIEELIKFPAGKYNDAIDVCSTFGMAINEAHPAISWDVQSKKSKDPYDSLFNELENDNSWRTK